MKSDYKLGETVWKYAGTLHLEGHIYRLGDDSLSLNTLIKMGATPVGPDELDIESSIAISSIRDNPEM